MRVAILFALAVVTSSCQCGAPPKTGEGEGEGEGAGEGEGEGSVQCRVDSDCADGNACTTDHCDNGTCTHGQALDGTPCGASPCTDNKACVLGFCTDGHAPNLDADGDGFLTSVCGGNDCDDNDASVHPGATEGPPGDPTCSDGKDNDCNGAADALDAKCGNTELCLDGWCFENPRPHGFPLAAVWPAADDDVWIGSQFGGGFAHFDGTGFTIEQSTVSGFAPNIARMWGSSSTDIYAAAGVIMHYDGTSWSVDTSAQGLGQFTDVWGFAPNDVWAVGFNVAAHFDGTAWTPFNLNTTETFTAVHGIASDDVWAVGQGPLAAHWDGTSWTTNPITTATPPPTLTSVFEDAAGDVWAGGDVSQMWHVTGATGAGTDAWSAVPSLANHRAAALAVGGPDDVWAVGDGGVVQHWNGQSWGQAAVFPSALLGMRMISPTDIWATGQNALIVHYDGTAWSRAAAPPDPLDARLLAVTAASSTTAASGFDAWAAGVDAVTAAPIIGKRDDSGVWHVDTTFTSTTGIAPFNAMTAVADDDVWALGGTTGAHWDGTQWTTANVPIANTANVAQVCNNGAGKLWAISTQDFVGEVVDVVQGDGTSWSSAGTIDAPISGDPPIVSHVFCTGGAAGAAVGNPDDDVWLGGVQNVFHRDPASGNFVRTGTASIANMQAPIVAASSSSDVWFFDRGSSAHTLAHYDGVDVKDASAASLGLTGDVLDIEDLAGDVWIAGTASLLAHEVNGAFVQQNVGAVSDDFAFVAPLANGHVMLVDRSLVTYEWDGATLATKSTTNPGVSSIQAVSFDSDTDGWAIEADFNEAYRWDGAAWTRFDSFASPAFFRPTAVAAFSTSDVWVGGDTNSSIAHFDGQSWSATSLTAENPDAIRSIWGTSSDDVWAVSESFAGVSTLWHKTTGGFQNVALPSSLSNDQEQRFRAVHGATSPTDLWIVGNEGVFSQRALIVRGDASQSTFARFETLDDPVAIGVVAGHTLAIDAFGGVFQRSSTTGWAVLNEPVYDPQDPVSTFEQPVTTAILVESGPFFGFTLGSSGIATFDGVHLNPGSQSVLGFGSAQAFGAGGGEVFAVGGGDNVLHRSN